jgi:hypothetical protein
MPLKKTHPAPRQEERSEQIHVRLTPTERREFEAFARRQSVPLGALMRQALIEKIRRDGLV